MDHNIAVVKLNTGMVIIDSHFNYLYSKLLRDFSFKTGIQSYLLRQLIIILLFELYRGLLLITIYFIPNNSSWENHTIIAHFERITQHKDLIEVRFYNNFDLLAELLVD
jgi:hypothetical protein